MRVLIVDDEPTLRQMVRLTLDETHEVQEAGDGAAALEAIRNGVFDVVLLDQKMPGMSGVETLAEIRNLAPATRVVMLTAFASLDLASAALAGGASHFLAKPMTPALLRAAVAAAKPHQAATVGVLHHEHTITLNGFTIDAAHTSRVGSNGSATHVFTVSHVVGGWTKHVEVQLARDAFRRSGRPDIAIGGRLAAMIARRALSNELWQQGMLPERDRLEVRDVSDVEIAAALREDVR